MAACEKLYASLANSLLSDIVKSPEPSAERAVDILAMLQSESRNESQSMTTAILESTKIGNVLTKTVKACRRHRRARTSSSSEVNHWDRALSIAEELLNDFKRACEAEKKQSQLKKKSSKRKASRIVTPDAGANAEKKQPAKFPQKSSATASMVPPDAQIEIIEIKSSEDNSSVHAAPTHDAACDGQKNQLEVADNNSDANAVVSESTEPADEELMDDNNHCQPCQDIIVYSENSLPASRYKVAQRIYAKDDATGLLYPAFVRKVMWGPKSNQITLGFCSSLVDGEPIAGVNNDDNRGEDEDDMDEDERRWGPKRNCWHYYVHYMGWNVKWDRWVEEAFLYDDMASTEILSKTLLKEYKKVKPKKKGQKMSAFEVSQWMKKMSELESEHKRLEEQGNMGGEELEKDGHINGERVSKDDYNNGKVGEAAETMQEHFKKTNPADTPVKVDTHAKAETPVKAKTQKKRRKTKPIKRQITQETLQKQAHLRESGLQMKRKKTLSDQLTLPFNLKKILVEEWEVITQCDMVHNLPSKVTVREALNQYLESKLAPLRKKHVEDTKDGAKNISDKGDDKMKVDEASTVSNSDAEIGKEWTDMVEGIALLFDQSLSVHLLFAEERSQYGSLRRQILAQRRNSAASAAAAVSSLSVGDSSEAATKANGGTEQSTPTTTSDNVTVTVSESTAPPINAKSPPLNFLPERMSEIYGCEHLLRLFIRLPAIVSEAPTISGPRSRGIFSKLGDLVRYLQKNQSTLFQSSFRKLLPEETRRGGKKVGGK